MVSDHGLTANEIKQVEKELSDINTKIVGGCKVLSHNQGHLGRFHRLLSCEPGRNHNTTCSSSTGSRKKAWLSCFRQGVPPHFPLNKQSFGTRSLGTVLTFWAHMQAGIPTAIWQRYGSPCSGVRKSPKLISTHRRRGHCFDRS